MIHVDHYLLVLGVIVPQNPQRAREVCRKPARFVDKELSTTFRGIGHTDARLERTSCESPTSMARNFSLARFALLARVRSLSESMCHSRLSRTS